MSFEIRKASKVNRKLRLGLFGQSGGGKTYSALRVSMGMLGSLDKVCVIDTEQGSSELYLEKFPGFSVGLIGAPYYPGKYRSAIDSAVEAGFELIIIDSVSHAWDGEGGALEINQKYADTKCNGNTFTAWKYTTPLYRKFIESIINSPVHMIVTGRKKTDYVMDTNSRGKQAPRKVGLKDITREGLDYEMTVSFDISQNHMACPTKDRTGLFMIGEDDPIPAVLDEETGKTLAKWCGIIEEK